MNSVFGQYYVYLLDGEHSLALKPNECHQLLNNVPLVCRSLLELFYLEDIIQAYIEESLSDVENPSTELVPQYLLDRLIDEVSL